ncbi:Ku protein [Anatilimnocola sp. NA78]|uniref:non-homologous end joining protein Ku n=1 Tax=Anatilimnocola sp. NA78 TaxID=3415683 RepID=UPI003CE4CF8B
MPRSTWKGYLKLSFVSVPVKGYSANTGAESIRLNQLHGECHSRIQYQKVCPVHGKVPADEIVSAYEYADNQYVVIDPKELKALRTRGERAVNIEAVVKADAVDPLYFTEKAYYLLPDGAVGQRPYALLQQSLADDKRCAIAKAVLYGREELVLIRPVENLLSMTALKFDAEVRRPQVLGDELETPALQDAEIKLTRTLLKAFVRPKFNIESFKDDYVESLTELIEAKVAGKKIVTAPAEDEPPIINLMDALKKSLAAVGNGETSRSKKTAGPRMTSASRRKAAPKRRKSG